MDFAEVLMHQNRMTDGMKDDGEPIRLQVHAFKSIFVPDCEKLSKIPTIRVVTLDDIAYGKEAISNVEEECRHLDIEDGNPAWAMADAALSSRRTRYSRKSVKYKEDESDQSSGESSSESMYSLSSMDEDDLSDGRSAGEGSRSQMEIYEDEDISNISDSYVDECRRQIAYVDAFSRVAAKPPMPCSMVPPCIISTRQGLQCQYSQDTSSMTMSLSNQMEDEKDLFPEVQQIRSRKRTLLDTLAEAAEQVSKKPSHGNKKLPVQKQGEYKRKPMDASLNHGFNLEYGMVCIHSDALREFAQHDPIYQDNALRWKGSEWSDDMLPSFHSRDNIQNCVQYLHYAARMSGRLIDPPLQVQKNVVEQYAKYEDMLDNIASLHKRLRYGGMPTSDIRITRKLQKKLDLSVSPIIFSPRRSLDGKKLSIKTNQGFSAKRTAVVQGDPASGTDVRWGACYQVDMLPFPKGGKESEIQREERLGGRLVMERGTIPPQMQKSPTVEEYINMQPKDLEKAILHQSNQFIDLLGPKADLLGLRMMGAHAKGMLTEEQQIAYGEGMKKYGRNFSLIQKTFLPTVSCGSMASYYYDVWKTQSVPTAVKFYQELDHGDDSNALNATQIVDSIKWVKYRAQNPRPESVENTSSDAPETLGRALSCLQKKSKKGPNE